MKENKAGWDLRVDPWAEGSPIKRIIRTGLSDR
jgi:hypothetical protein